MRTLLRPLAAIIFAWTISAPIQALAQDAPTAPPAAPPVRNRVGGFVPGQKRPPEDPEVVARGKSMFGLSCRACHGADLRGGDMGGPNLLRSQVALSDRQGELIVPIIQGSRQNAGMPAIPMSPEDAKAVAAYVRSVIATIGGQGTPPSAGKPALSILVGSAAEGQAYFAAKCSSCHSPSGDLQGIASKVSDPKTLQTAWVAGGVRRGPQAKPPRPAAVTVTLPSGETVTGEALQIDDFLVSLKLADGSVKSFRRVSPDVPKVDLRDPMKAHRDLLSQYTDRDIHDVTAYLVTLK